MWGQSHTLTYFETCLSESGILRVFRHLQSKTPTVRIHFAELDAHNLSGILDFESNGGRRSLLSRLSFFIEMDEVLGFYQQLCPLP